MPAADGSSNMGSSSSSATSTRSASAQRGQSVVGNQIFMGVSDVEMSQKDYFILNVACSVLHASFMRPSFVCFIRLLHSLRVRTFMRPSNICCTLLGHCKRN